MASQLYVPLYDQERTATPSTVAVTGASGFVAGRIVERLLAAGHTVHATVRDPSSESAVGAIKALPGASERLKLFKANLLEPGSFNEAVKGCRFVIHTASPFFTPDDLNDVKPKLLEPAVNGTINILEAVNNCPTVERVVLTSSMAAIFSTNVEEGHVFTENDWNTSSSETNNPYAYSKTLAEKKAWEIANAQNRWKLVCINPVYVFGPPVGERFDGESIKIVSGIFEGNSNDKPTQPYPIVDVRDVAAAHCLAMMHPKAHGRNICFEGKYNVAELCAFFHDKYPTVKVPEAEPESTKPATISNKKLPSELGLEWHSTRQCMQDMITKLVDIGRVKVPE